MRRAFVVLGLLLLALPAYGTGQEIWVEFECVTNQAGITIPMFSVEGRPGAEFIVNNQPVGAVLNGGYGVEGENTWTATALPGFELTSPSSGVVSLDCGGFESAGCYGRNKCNTTTTTSTTAPGNTSSTTTTITETTTTSVGSTTTTSLLPTTTTTAATTTSTVAASSTTSPPTTNTLPPSSTDPTVAPADAGSQLPYTGLSHDVWAGLTFVGFWLLTMGGMAVLAGRDDE